MTRARETPRRKKKARGAKSSGGSAGAAGELPGRTVKVSRSTVPAIPDLGTNDGGQSDGNLAVSRAAPARIGYGAQLTLGTSAAITSVGAIALLDDRLLAYIVPVASSVCGTVVGLVVRRRARTLIAFCITATMAALLAIADGWAGWLLIVVSLVTAIALAAAPSRLSRRAGRLLAPTAAALALTALAVAVTFYARPGPSDFDSSTSAFLRTQGGGPAPLGLQVNYFFHGCSHPVEISFTYGEPTKPNGDHAIVQPLNVLGVVTTDPFDVLAPHQTWSIQGIGAAAISTQSPSALIRPIRRGIGSCYLQIPGFFGPWAEQPDVLDLRTLDGYTPLTDAENVVFLGGGTLSVDSGGAPTEDGDPTIWRCQAAIAQQTVTDQASCGAVVVLTDDWFQTWQQVMLVVLGILTAVLVGLAGRAMAHLGWLSVE